MASTANPLNEFNSYSYHHFLIMVNSTDVANTLYDTETLFKFLNGTQPVPGAYAVINPLVSNRFVIQEAEWTNLLAPNPADFGSAAWSGGTFKVIEPRGISFMNEIYNAAQSLSSTLDGTQWILKTVFIGDTGVGDYNSPQRYEYINTIKPMTIVVTDIGIRFDESGGEYEFQFVLSDAGAGAFGHVDGAAFSMNTTINLALGSANTAGVTFEHAIARLEQHVNESYEKQYAVMQKTTSAQPSVPEFKKMQIKIEIPEALKKPEYIIVNAKGQGMGRDGYAASVTVTPGTPLTDVIQELITSCPALLQDCAGPDNSKRTYFNVISSVRIQDDNEEYKKIYTFSVLPKHDEMIANADEKREAIDKAIEAGNYIEYDYLYTGKNVDVLSFDMKFNAGIVFFTTLLSQSSTRDDRSEAVSSEHVQSASSMPKIGATGAASVYYPTKLAKADHNDKVNPDLAERYDQIMQEAIRMDNIIANIKIRGNPRIMADVMPTRTAIDAALKDITLEGEGLMQAWATQPARCQVNVYMPKDGDYENLEKFWYDGLYRILSVKNSFSGGSFEQELELITDGDGVFSAVQSNPQVVDKTEQFSEIVGEPTEVEQRIRAFMQTIRHCEGTTGDTGYRIMFNNVPITNGLVDHPRTIITAGSYQSSAAGAYQILTKTWDTLTSRHSELTDFQPATQDKACYYLLLGRDAINSIRANDISGAIMKCNREWASLPGSPYGQPRKTLANTLGVYQEYLEKEKAGQTTLKIGIGELPT